MLLKAQPHTFHWLPCWTGRKKEVNLLMLQLSCTESSEHPRSTTAVGYMCLEVILLWGSSTGLCMRVKVQTAGVRAEFHPLLGAVIFLSSEA